MPRDHRWLRWASLAALVAGVLTVIVVVARGSRVPDGPMPVAWNHQPCAHCRMLVGEPAHAAQLVDRTGEAAFFDDPGCLLQYLDDRAPDVHRIWFHDSTSAGWLSSTEVGFVSGATTPMGFGLAAVPRATPGAIDLATARLRVLAGPVAPSPSGGHP